jgi:diaminopimelate decarboxylase
MNDPLNPNQNVELLQKLATQLGTPFWLYDAAEMRRRIADVKALTAAPGLQARYAMKASPSGRILREIKKHGLWIDAVSANECFRAQEAGFSKGNNPPEILYTADVFRGEWQQAILGDEILPNIGSPGMVRDLAEKGYQGPLALRINVGFGHGHVNACDTGGPSSKHGIWWEDALETVTAARQAGMPIVMLHAHVGSGPKQQELRDNLKRLIAVFSGMSGDFPDLQAISVGGGLPWNYRQAEKLDVEALAHILKEGQQHLSKTLGREIRLEIEPGRYYIASSCTLVTQVMDLKKTRSNEKGTGVEFIMVDAGFTDLVRPAMYGSYHRISIPARAHQPTEPFCVAGPLCESGDVFTRGADEMLEPRALPRPERGDLMCLHDAGAYGYAMSSHYNSLGRAPQVWVEEDGSVFLMSRRETLADLTAAETDEKL